MQNRWGAFLVSGYATAPETSWDKTEEAQSSAAPQEVIPSSDVNCASPATAFALRLG